MLSAVIAMSCVCMVAPSNPATSPGVLRKNGVSFVVEKLTSLVVKGDKQGAIPSATLTMIANGEGSSSEGRTKAGERRGRPGKLFS